MNWSDKGGDKFEQPPLGSHVARCIALIDLGTRAGIYGEKRDVLVRWELPGEVNKEGEVATASAFYNQSLNEKANLRIMLKSWRGRDFTEEEARGFDARNILGKPCLLSIIEKKTQKGDIKHVVSAVTAIPKGMAVPEQVTPSLYFSLDNYDSKVFEQLGEGVQKMVKESAEYKVLDDDGSQEPPQYHAEDSDVPF